MDSDTSFNAGNKVQGKKADRVYGSDDEGSDLGEKVVAVALYDYEGATDEELNCNEGDRFFVLEDDSDDWLLLQSVDDPSNQGYLPASYVRFEDDEESEESDDEGKSNKDQGKLKNKFDELAKSVLGNTGSNNASLPEMQLPSNVNFSYDIKDFGDQILPSFRISTLGKLWNEGKGRTSTFLHPQLTANGNGFQNLFVDGRKHRIRKKSTKCATAFSVFEAKNLPLPGPDVQILGRHVRMALFDKNAVLSNIHTTPVIYNPDQPKTWKFSSKSSVLFPKDDENTCFVRADQVDFKLCILFELCFLVSKVVLDKDGKPGHASAVVGEVSCGWGVLPLFTAEGKPIENRSYEIRLFGGTPLEKDVDLIGTNEKKNLWQMIVNSDKSPRLVVKVWKLRKSALEEINKLPDTLISFLSAVPVLSSYRQSLANHLVTSQNEPRLSPIYNPVLKLVPKIAEQTDLMKLLIGLWDTKVKSSKRSERRSPDTMSRKFLECVASVWPLSHIVEIPGFVAGDETRHQLRTKYFYKIHGGEGIVNSLTTNPHKLSYAPFSTDELRYDYLLTSKNSSYNVRNVGKVTEIASKDAKNPAPVLSVG